MQLEQQHNVHLGKGFFCTQGVRARECSVPDGALEIQQWLERLAVCTNEVAADAYGERVLFPYWPFQMWSDHNEDEFNALLVKLLVTTPHFSAKKLMSTDLAHYYYRSRHRVRKAPAQLREPAPPLPWLFSKDIDVVLDARTKPLVAFTYAWVEVTQLSEPAPPGVPTCAHEKHTTHTVDVPYKTSLPLLCAFAAPPQPRLLSGSFFASPDDDGGRAFYRGMMPSALKQRRPLRADDMME